MSEDYFLQQLRTKLERLSQVSNGAKLRSPLFRLLKAELTKMGHWKNKARGDGGRTFKTLQKSKTKP